MKVAYQLNSKIRGFIKNKNRIEGFRQLKEYVDSIPRIPVQNKHRLHYAMWYCGLDWKCYADQNATEIEFQGFLLDSSHFMKV